MKRRLGFTITVSDEEDGYVSVSLQHRGHDREYTFSDSGAWLDFWSETFFTLMHGYGENEPYGIGSQMDRRLAVNQAVAGSIPVQYPEGWDKR